MMKDRSAEIWKILRELAISQRKTDAAIDRLQESQKKTDEQLKKTDEQLKKTDEQIKNLGREIGSLTDGWGRFVEGLVEPSVPVVLSRFGIRIRNIYQRARSRIDGREMEIDLLCLGRRYRYRVLVAVEVKSSLTVRDVRDHLKRLDQFFDFFSDYKGWDLIGVVAGIRVSRQAIALAEKEGLYILSPSGETMVVLNREGFQPRIWH